MKTKYETMTSKSRLALRTAPGSKGVREFPRFDKHGVPLTGKAARRNSGGAFGKSKA